MQKRHGRRQLSIPFSISRVHVFMLHYIEKCKQSLQKR